MRYSRVDPILLFCARMLRLFGFGFVSITLALYLISLGFDERTAGFIFTLALLGDIAISLVLTTSADRFGRRRMLIFGACLFALTGAVLAATDNFYLIAVVAVVGVISPSGNEIGPFLSIEQAALSQSAADGLRTRIFAWYNLVGSFAAALGALAGGGFVQGLQRAGFSELMSYRWAFVVYAGLGSALAILFVALSPEVEAPAPAAGAPDRRFGLHRSRSTVFKLSGLFALDAFAGGFVIQSLVAYWFHVRFGASPFELGAIFFGANVLAGLSGLVAARMADRLGLIETMVYTHIPSNVLLMLVPFMPSLGSAVAVLLVRFSISQMDVPTRQSFTMAVVSPDERSAASGVTNTARSIGALVSPALSGALLAVPALMAAPFLLAGGLKIVYDVLLYRSFRAAQSKEPRVE